MARIDGVLRRIPDAQLRAELTSAIAEVRRTKDFGPVGHRRTASGDFVTDFDTYRALSFDCYGTLIDWETAS